ncbi:MAG: T9SS type A sorting domain-containing protein, partial [Sphingobacteriales bacterium]
RTVKVSSQATITPILKTYPGLTNVVDVQGGQYHVTALDQQGKVYKLSNNATFTTTPTDEFGAAFTGNFLVRGFWQANVSLRGADSSLWYWGIADPMNYAAGATITAPKKLVMPAGKKFKKVETGANWTLGDSYILALASDNTVWKYSRGNVNPVQISIAGETFKDIAVLGSNAQVLLTNSNKIYGAGILSTYVGTTSNTSTFQNVTTAWTNAGVRFPIKELVANSSTLHIIDANDHMFGSGTNVQGEVGTGVEYSPYRIAGPQGGVFGYGFANNLLVTAPVQIQGKFKNINTSTTITFYLYVQDMGNNWYSWGRNKAFSLGNGKSLGPYAGWGGTGDYANYPNALDVPMPKRVDPANVVWTLQNFSPTDNIPPVVGAGINQYLSGVSSTTLYGKAFQQEFSIASQQWTKVSGPAGGNITSPTSLNTVITGLVNGTYVYRLAATNSKGQTSTDEVSVIISGATPPPPANVLPTVNAGTNQTITLPTATATLTGTATDSDGSISNYLWTKVSGPAGGNIVSASTASTAINSLLAGTYTYSLKVTDNAGGTATATVTITVNAAANVLPTVNAGADKTVTLPASTTTLSGSGSDTDGTISTYLWTKVSGPTGGNIANTASASTGITALTAGTYVYSLKVTDNAGGTATDSVRVIVNAAANVLPTVNAGTDQTITLPATTATLTGTAADTDGTIRTYLWTKVSGPTGGNIVNTATASTGITALIAGTYVYSLKVTDNAGGTATDSVKVTVKPAAATVTLLPAVNPANTVNGLDYQYYEGSWRVLPAFETLSPVKTGTTPNFNVGLANRSTQYGFSFSGYILVPADGQYKFFTSSDDGSNLYIDNVLVVANDGLHSVTEKSGVIGLKAGKHAIKGLFFQGTGGSVFTVSYEATGITKQTIPASALYRVNQLPLANAGTVADITLPVNSATLSGSGTDPDGSISTYLWKKLSGPSQGTIASPSSATTTLNNLVQGTYTFELTVTDNNSQSAKATVQLVVKPAQTVLSTGGKIVRVNIDNSKAPMTSVAWNNWTIAANASSNAFKYEDGTASTITAAIPQGGNYSDNGDAYGAGATICPPQVLRIASMHTITRVLTFSGLNPSKDYSLEFFGSRGYTSNSKSIFTIGKASDTINTDYNVSDYAKFASVQPDASGKITVTISHTGSYNYLSGFQIAEGAGAISPAIAEPEKMVYQGETLVEMGGNSVSVYPNPFVGSFKVQLNQREAGEYVIRMSSTSGQTVMSKRVMKPAGTFAESINVSSLTPGTYILEIISVANGSKSVHKVIKN